MRRPNGTGSISKLSGNRRNKYVVRTTIGYELDHEKGKVKQKQVVLGYAATKKETQEILEKYNSNPYDLSFGKLTFEEVYHRMYETKVGQVKEASLKSYEYAFSLCKELHNRVFVDLKFFDLQNLIDKSDKNFPSLKKVHTLLKLMYKYAVKYDLVTKDYSQHLDLSVKKASHEEKPEEEKHMTHDEVRLLWKHKDNEFIQSILVLCWIGVRVEEFLRIKKEDVHLKEHYFTIRKGKTDNAPRDIPIADIVYPYFEKWYYDGDSEYLFHRQNGKRYSYDSYLNNFKAKLRELGMHYTPHACRHTFNSLLADLEITGTIRAKLMGQSLNNITDDVYTHLDMSVLLHAINQLELILDEDWLLKRKKGVA